MAFVSMSTISVAQEPRQQDSLQLILGEWPPYTSRELPYKGLITRIVSEALATQYSGVNIGFTSWADAYQLTLNGDGKIASAGWLITPEREADMRFSDPIVHIRNVFFHRAERDFSWKTADDLAAYRIGVTRGYSYGPVFEAARKAGQLKLLEASSDLENLQRLQRREIDLFPVDFHVGQHLIEHNLDPRKGVLQADETPLVEDRVYLILPKGSDASGRWLEVVNKGLRNLKKSGRYLSLLEDQPVVAALARYDFLTEENAPLNYLDSSGKLSGISVALMDRLLEQIGSDRNRADFQVLSWARAYQSATTKRRQVLFAVSRTPEREELFHWVGPIYRANVVLLGRKGAQTNTDLRRLAGKICAVREDVGHQQLRRLSVDESQIELVSRGEQCAGMLKAKRLDYWAFSQDTAEWYLSKSGVSMDDIRVIRQLTEAPRYIAFSHDTQPLVLEAFRRSLNYLTLSGELEQIIQEELEKASLSSGGGS